MDLDLSVRIGNLVLPNPVGVASGTFGYGEEYRDLIDVDRLGALYAKAVTLEPREGNKPPRLVETPQGLINSIGLANPGLAGFIERKLPYLKTLRCPVIVNVSGSSEADYLAVVEGIEAAVGRGKPGGAKRRRRLRDQRLLPQCIARRHVLRNRPRPRGAPDFQAPARHRASPHRQAQPERHRYRGNRPLRRKPGEPTPYPASTPWWAWPSTPNAARPSSPEARAGSPDRRYAPWA